MVKSVKKLNPLSGCIKLSIDTLINCSYCIDMERDQTQCEIWKYNFQFKGISLCACMSHGTGDHYE